MPSQKKHFMHVCHEKRSFYIASLITAHTILYEYFLLLLFIVNKHSKLSVINSSFIGKTNTSVFF